MLLYRKEESAQRGEHDTVWHKALESNGEGTEHRSAAGGEKWNNLKYGFFFPNQPEMKELTMLSFWSTLFIFYKSIRLELQYVFRAFWCKHTYI